MLMPNGGRQFASIIRQHILCMRRYATVLGDHVQQKGSLVAPDRLRFDFSHYEGVTSEQLREIENIVNDEIRRNVAADTKLMSYDDAVASGCHRAVW